MSEYEFVCPTCEEELTFVGDKMDAEADCPNCGTVWICPDELFASEEAEREIDHRIQEG